MRVLRPIFATINRIKNLLKTEQIPFSYPYNIRIIAQACKSIKGIMRNSRFIWPILNVKIACAKKLRGLQ